VCSEGGVSGLGSVFKTDANGANIQTVKSFENPGAHNAFLSDLCEGPNGKLYGLSNEGRVHGKGLLTSTITKTILIK
jgi:hypothetical protein